MTEVQLKRQREARKRTGNAITKRYEKTVNGFLMRTYRNMQSRVTGVQKKKAHLYKGLPLMSRKEFYSWAKADKVFTSLFSLWTALDYPRGLTPSINRIDSNKGYIAENVEWITHSQNSQLGAMSRHGIVKTYE